MRRARNRDFEDAQQLIDEAQVLLLDLNRVVGDLSSVLKASGSDARPDPDDPFTLPR